MTDLLDTATLKPNRALSAASDAVSWPRAVHDPPSLLPCVHDAASPASLLPLYTHATPRSVPPPELLLAPTTTSTWANGAPLESVPSTTPPAAATALRSLNPCPASLSDGTSVATRTHPRLGSTGDTRACTHARPQQPAVLVAVTSTGLATSVPPKSAATAPVPTFVSAGPGDSISRCGRSTTVLVDVPASGWASLVPAAATHMSGAGDAGLCASSAATVPQSASQRAHLHAHAPTLPAAAAPRRWHRVRGFIPAVCGLGSAVVASVVACGGRLLLLQPAVSRSASGRGWECVC